MVQIESCNCAAMDDEELDTWKKFEKAKEYFETQVKQGFFEEEKVTKPYHTWRCDGVAGLLGLEKRYATKWYRCRVCGCLWEIKYPDFPLTGFVRKLENGEYVPLEE